MILSRKTILITGAGGFIGSHVVEEAVRRGAAVRAMVRYNSRGHWGHLEDLRGEIRGAIEVRPGDVRDAGFVRDAVRGCNVVLHLAALIGIPFSYVASESYVQVNIEGTLNVLRASLGEGVERMVHTSTSEVYGTARYVPIDEMHPLQPQSPYSATKIAADMLAESFFRSFDLPLVIIRPFNTYGPRQSARAVIPTILSQLASGQGRLRLGDLQPVRDLTYVDDTARAFLDLACCGDALGKTVNVGTGEGISIGDLADLAMEITGVKAEIQREAERTRPPKSEVYRLVCAPDEARRLIQWEPEVALRDGLTRTWEYILAHTSRYKPEIYGI